TSSGERRNTRALPARRGGDSLVRSHHRIGGGFFSGRQLRLQRGQCVVEVVQRLIENLGAKPDTIDCHIDRPTTESATKLPSCSELRTSREHWRRSYFAALSDLTFRYRC